LTTPSSRQTTLRHAISCSGIGLHSGAAVSLTLHPAASDTGIQFVRRDRPRSLARIAARWNTVVDTRLSTTIANESGTRVATVEHLMAALYGCGVDNVTVEVDGPEIPVMDGSAAPFVCLVECAGLVEQAAMRRYLRVLKRCEHRDGGAWASLSPANGLSIHQTIEYDNRLIAKQSMSFDLGSGSFKNELARARTYGFANEVEMLRRHGLARGGSLDNAVVVDGERVLNEGGLRFRDEFVRHKALDTVGDLALAGARLIGRFDGWCSGHSTNNALLRALFADVTAWRLETAGEAADDRAAEWAPVALATA
jgi:UDP-3-O-[3-hydroxymyristoyl] N-acetylglucosamine deacetylase